MGERILIEDVPGERYRFHWAPSRRGKTLMPLLLALALHLAQPALAFTPWRAWDSAFRNDREATNFSAHVGWSLAIPLAGHAIGGKRGALIAGGAWMAATLVNELALHGPTPPRERNQDLLSALLPCALVMLWELL